MENQRPRGGGRLEKKTKEAGGTGDGGAGGSSSKVSQETSGILLS